MLIFLASGVRKTAYMAYTAGAAYNVGWKVVMGTLFSLL